MTDQLWMLASRAVKMNPSVIREILKLTEKPGMISFAGGLPSPETFPVEEFLKACQSVLQSDGRAALQYSVSEGYLPLREKVASWLNWNVDPEHVLITSGSQQGLDLLAKILIDSGSRILVETPTYLGALQAFTPMEPNVVSVLSNEQGLDLRDLSEKIGTGNERARFLYVLPNYQNPTGRTMSEAGRKELMDLAIDRSLPLIEDNPYGDLWYDRPPPSSLTSRAPSNCVYLGSFSKVLAPGLRLGYVVAPEVLMPKLLQAKQAADLHTPTFNQRIVSEVIKNGFLERHVPTIRSLYKKQCQAMLDALEKEMSGMDVTWNSPDGGMFLWLQLPEGLDSLQLLPRAVENGVAFVPGAAFYASRPDPRALRLSFVTVSVDQIHQGIAALAETIRRVQSEVSSFKT